MSIQLWHTLRCTLRWEHRLHLEFIVGGTQAGLSMRRMLHGKQELGTPDREGTVDSDGQ